MKKLFFISLILLISLSAAPVFANSSSRFKQFIVPLDCTLDIIDTGIGNPYALVQPEDCTQPPDNPTNPNTPSGNTERQPYYPLALPIDEYDATTNRPTGGSTRAKDFWPLSFVRPDILVLIAVLVIGLWFNWFKNRPKKAKKHDKHR